MHLHRTGQYKSVRLDVVLRQPLREGGNTRLALIGRLLERGSRRLPDMQSLNRFADHLYGAHFSVEVDQVGEEQLLHLCFEVLDERYAAGKGEDLLGQATEFLGQVLADPACLGEGFRPDYLAQEKAALKRQIEGLFNDKAGYAQRRCLEEMCRGERMALSPLGHPRHLRGIRGVPLRRFHRRLLERNPLEVFISGDLDPDRAVKLCRSAFSWPRQCHPLEPLDGPCQRSREPREVFEYQQVHQGCLVQGYRTHTGLADEDYAALMTFNALWGGESHGRLFSQVREQAGLCYNIASYLEPVCGLLFAVAGIGKEDYEPVQRSIKEQLEAIRQQGPQPEEVALARGLLGARLRSLEGDRGGLVRFYMRRVISGNHLARSELIEKLESVTEEDVRRVARKVELDTTYFLHGDRARERVAA